MIVICLMLWWYFLVKLIGDICIVYIMLAMIIICIWVGVYFPSYFLSTTYLFLPNRCRRDVIPRGMRTTTMECQLTCNSYFKDKLNRSSCSLRTWATTTTMRHHHRLWTRWRGS